VTCRRRVRRKTQCTSDRGTYTSRLAAAAQRTTRAEAENTLPLAGHTRTANAAIHQTAALWCRNTALAVRTIVRTATRADDLQRQAHHGARTLSLYLRLVTDTRYTCTLFTAHGLYTLQGVLPAGRTRRARAAQRNCRWRHAVTRGVITGKRAGHAAAFTRYLDMYLPGDQQALS
jgi:hypothetical protein